MQKFLPLIFFVLFLAIAYVAFEQYQKPTGVDTKHPTMPPSEVNHSSFAQHTTPESLATPDKSSFWDWLTSPFRTFTTPKLTEAEINTLAQKATDQLFSLPCENAPRLLRTKVITHTQEADALRMHVSITWQGGGLFPIDLFMIGDFECNLQGCQLVWKPDTYSKAGFLFICESRLHVQELGCIAQ